MKSYAHRRHPNYLQYVFGILNDDGTIDFEVRGVDFRGALHQCPDVLCFDMSLYRENEYEQTQKDMRATLEARWRQEVARRGKESA